MSAVSMNWMFKCPKCDSTNTQWLTNWIQWITLDEYVDVNQYECRDCGYGWDE